MVFGIGHGPQLVAQSADVRFPAYREIGELRFGFYRTGANATVKICGEAAVAAGSTYVLRFSSTRFVEEVRVEVSGFRGLLPARIVLQGSA